MKHPSLHVAFIVLAVMTVLGVVAAGCAPAKPAAPAVPATPPAAAPPATPPAPTVPSAPPAAPLATAPAGGTLPVVNYFSVSSNSVPPNSIIILVWSVSGADSASIDNGIGQVNAEGRRAVLPLASTAFVLTATNAAGSVTARTAVEISDPAAISGYRPSYTIPQVQQSTVIGSPFTIKLEAQPSKGYNWVVDYYDSTMVSLAGSDYQAYGPPPRGSDGQQTFVFQPLKAGNTRILVSNVNNQTPTQFESVIYDIYIQQK